MVAKDFNLRSEQPLNVRPFADPHVGKGLLWDRPERRIGYFKEGHGVASFFSEVIGPARHSPAPVARNRRSNKKPQAVGYTGYGGRLATVPAISLVA